VRRNWLQWYWQCRTLRALRSQIRSAGRLFAHVVSQEVSGCRSQFLPKPLSVWTCKCLPALGPCEVKIRHKTSRRHQLNGGSPHLSTYPSAARTIPHMNNSTGYSAWIVVDVSNNSRRLSLLMEPLDIVWPWFGLNICANVCGCVGSSSLTRVKMARVLHRWTWSNAKL
jgi:hypothetical protein